MLRAAYSDHLTSVDQAFTLLEAAREQCRQGNTNDALAFVLIVRNDGDDLRHGLEAISVHLEDAKDGQRGLLNELGSEKATLQADLRSIQESIKNHQNDIQQQQWQREHVECLMQEADQRRCKAERVFDENKEERAAVRGWYYIPIVGWIGWAVKNGSCDAKMAAEKKRMEEADEEIAAAESSKDVVDGLLAEDERKLNEGLDRLEECERRMADQHELIGDLKQALSVLVRGRKVVEDIVQLADQACDSVGNLAEILGVCGTTPGLEKANGTMLRFDFTKKQWGEVKREMVSANDTLFNHQAMLQ